MIRQYMAHTRLTAEEKLQWEWEMDRMHRIELTLQKLRKTPWNISAPIIRTLRRSRFWPGKHHVPWKAWSLNGENVTIPERYATCSV